MRIITREFNNIGEKITIQLKYEDLEVSKLPDRCQECPVGFMTKNNDCGREYPMSETRPKTCKLKLIDLKNEFIKKRDKELEEKEKINKELRKWLLK